MATWKFSLVAQDDHSLTFTRRRTPQWAVVLAVIGFLFFLLGLLFLLVKETQTVLISFAPDSPSGTRIVITGAETPIVRNQIQSLLAPAADSSTSATPTAPQ